MKRLLQTAITLIALAAGLSLAQQPVRVLTHSSFDLPAELLARFTAETGYPLELLPAGDAGEVVNRAILTSGRPLADVLFGVDGSLLQRAVTADVFEPYGSERLSLVPERYLLSDDQLVTPVDVGYVAFNLDAGWFAEAGLPLPQSLEELTEPRYADLTVVMDPASSSPGLAFMLATIGHFGEDGWLDWWAALRDNGLQVVNGWTEGYYTAFTRYGGDRPIVLSYASSPAAEVIFAAEEPETAPTVNLLCEGCVYRQVEAAGVLRGAANPEGARAFIDFLLSAEVQAAIPLAMFVYPVLPEVELPAEFNEYADVPADIGSGLPAEAIQEGQAAWLTSWTQVVLQGRDPSDVSD